MEPHNSFFGREATFFFRGMFRSSDHCLVLPGANRRESIMRGQPRPLVRRFETLHALPIRLQIRNAKCMRNRTDNCTQTSNRKPRKYLGRRSDVRSRRKLHTLEAFALPYYLSRARLQTGMDAERHRRALFSRFFARTLSVQRSTGPKQDVPNCAKYRCVRPLRAITIPGAVETFAKVRQFPEFPSKSMPVERTFSHA